MHRFSLRCALVRMPPAGPAKGGMAKKSAKTSPPPPPPPVPDPPMAAPAPSTSCPSRWFRDPFDKALKKLVRPATSHTRRKEVIIRMKMPRETFEEILKPLQEGDVEGFRRDTATGRLIPTSTTATLRKFEYTIKKGSVSDRLFHLDTLDPPPPPAVRASKRKATEMLDAGEEDVYKVESIRDSRMTGKRTEYLVKWQDWPEDTNTWEPASHLNPNDIREFKGLPIKAAPTVSSLAPALHRRGTGAARARLSVAEQRRGAVPESISMICGNPVAKLSERLDGSTMPVAEFKLLVLTMDKAGHITWPTKFELRTQAALRLQARALLKKMIDDPENPVDATMAPALVGMGTSALWQGAPKRKLVVVEVAA